MDQSKILLGKALYVVRLLGWLLFFGGFVWSVVSWIWGGGLKELGTPEYAAFTAMFSVAVIYMSWHLYQPFRPSNRLGGMTDEFTSVRVSLEWYMNPGRIGQVEIEGRDEEIVRKLARALDGLRIPHPPVTGKGITAGWHRFLVRLGAEARVRNIRGARRLWGEMQSEAGGE